MKVVGACAPARRKLKAVLQCPSFVAGLMRINAVLKWGFSRNGYNLVQGG
jgi:hypothetical protein